VRRTVIDGPNPRLTQVKQDLIMQHVTNQISRMPKSGRVFCLAILPVLIGCGQANVPVASVKLPSLNKVSEQNSTETSESSKQKAKKMETATFGAGCFWCVEAVFQKLKGVETVRSGYMGGRTINPTYEDICTGLTGHAEVIQIEFDPAVISFAELLEVFWSTHDPTTLNRQGNDVGTQYRSAVFYHNEAQQATAQQYKKELNGANAFPNPIVTEIVPAVKMYVAEDYHQNYFNNNPNQPYCRAIIPAKLEKLKKVFADKLKESE
jgi:peptide-methionine (S)-S-oxide reductase